MDEKIKELIQHYIIFLQEDPSNEDEVYKWKAIEHFQQYWDIDTDDFYEMFKEAFRKRGNLVYQNPFSFLDALGKYFPEQLRNLFLIIYGSDDFYTKLKRAKDFAENSIEELKKKLNKVNFNHQLDERTLSFLLTMQNPDENTFYKKEVYKKLCEYLDIPTKKEEKYYHFIELLNYIVTLLNNDISLSIEKTFIPKGFDFPLLLAQDIVYQNISKGDEATKLYWLYSPGEQASKWEEFYNEGIMAIGWDELGDLENYTDRKSILDALIDNYRGGEDQRNNVSAIDDFCNKMNEGDIVIVKKGTKTLLGYGRVTSDYYFDEEREEFLHCRQVKWLKKGEWNLDFTLPRKTLTDITTYNSDVKEIKYAQYLLNIMNENTSNQEDNHIMELLKYKPQIILQGPPGTGKTREAKRIARILLGLAEDTPLEGNEQFKLIQFHPSYSYEDFVRGIVAKPNEEGDSIVYTAENKILGAFAKEAFNNWNKAQQNTQTLKEQDIFEAFIEHIKEELAQSEDYKYPLTDSIYIFNADDKRFKYKGDNWEVHSRGLNMNYAEIKRIIDSGIRDRQGVTKLTNIGGQARQHASYFIRIVEKYYEFKESESYKPNITDKIPLKPYVLIIDEINRANLSAVLGELIYALEYRGEAVQSMYAIDDDNTLVLSANLYIIGTMNTADRSVGHIDYAIRRRFAFVDILPKDLTNELGDNFAEKLYEEVSKLFEGNTLSPEFRKEEVQLGHSYFITEQTPIAIRWEYEIKPILLEYIKDGVLINVEEKIQNIEKIVYENSLA
ncbi:AAA family ATPase [Capnocytophaga granulosa]|uniref:AAA family ATPase n=1 Tax=Capnocytophaga granulosa TaxID=45242 RepID=UPI0028D6B3DA|nr:AAA family ATPase [Capnocytophaga granulosa]